MAARRRRENVSVAVLVVLAVLGGGRAIFDLVSSDTPSDTSAATASTVGHAYLATSFAEEFVTAYLSSVTGQQDRIAEYLGTQQRVTLPAVAREVSDPMVVYVSRALSDRGVEIWSVTVSVRVATIGATTGTTREFYRVSVSVIEGRLRAIALPSVVEPPARAPVLALTYTTPCAQDSPLTQVASGFLAAFLTGTGDVSRYTTSAAGISALRPAPFAGVDSVTVLADDAGCGAGGSTAKVLATVDPKRNNEAATTLAYPLTMVRSAGQWQVASVDPVPALTNPLAVVGGKPDSAGPAGVSTTTRSPTVQIPPPVQK
ncbi:conjugal transfer protein [Nocardia colli]|uniref:Conjugal transfer protein n=2 Tax=Nocardia colli TaxID=2545717 RepID=A0A5N0DZW5_9NOCA|nr:conjugal transfer protein [Nocardia colli]